MPGLLTSADRWLKKHSKLDLTHVGTFEKYNVQLPHGWNGIVLNSQVAQLAMSWTNISKGQ